MLFNPEWDKNPSIEGFSRFLDNQPSGQQYDWTNCEECAIGKYAESIGRTYWGIDEALRADMECRIAMPTPHTFGDAGTRAKALV